MTYVVLARKYRPKHFSEMVGQPHVVTALGNALTTRRLHHAYLFTGTRGVGKTTVSRILAKSLNCVGPDGRGDITPTPCGVCPACRDIDSGRFVDYTELDAASNRGVDEVQALLEQAVYKPVQGRFKVFMIDEVHMLSNTAFNAMLKTLEEPPEYLKFVLATTDPQKVPVTVLSRCLQFNLRPMAPETIVEHLEQVLKAEGVTSEPAALRLLARAARGSMRDALSLTDQAIAYGDGQLQETTVRLMLGTVGNAHVLSLVESLAQGDGAAVVVAIDEVRAQGLSAASTLEEMTHLLQRMAVAQLAHVEPDPIDPQAQDVLRLARLLPADQTQLLYSLCLHGRTELGLAPDEYAALVMVLLRLLAFQPPEQRARVLAEKKSPEPAVGLTPPAAAGRPVSVPAAKPGAIPQSIAVAPEGIPRSSDLPPMSAAAGLPQAPDGVSRTPAFAAQPSITNGCENSSVSHTDIHAAAIISEEINVRSLPSAQVLPVNAVGDRQGATSADNEGDFWFELVQTMARAETISALVRELALQAQLVARDAASSPPRWHLRIENPSLNATGTRERLQMALTQHGHAVQLVAEVGPVVDSPSRRLAAAAARQLQAAEQTLTQDPLVQAMVREFGGKIVPGSIQPLSPTP